MSSRGCPARFSTVTNIEPVCTLTAALWSAAPEDPPEHPETIQPSKRTPVVVRRARRNAEVMAAPSRGQDTSHREPDTTRGEANPPSRREAEIRVKDSR